MKLTREREIELIVKLIAEIQAMIKLSGRFFDEVEISFFDVHMYFKLDENVFRIKLKPKGLSEKTLSCYKKAKRKL